MIKKIKCFSHNMVIRILCLISFVLGISLMGYSQSMAFISSTVQDSYTNGTLYTTSFITVTDKYIKIDHQAYSYLSDLIEIWTKEKYDTKEASTLKITGWSKILNTYETVYLIYFYKDYSYNILIKDNVNSHYYLNLIKTK